MTQLIEYIKLALMNIRSNKVRTFLTMLGIIIGVSSVILIISIGNGVRVEIDGALNDIAGGQLNIRSTKSAVDGNYIEFSPEDLRAIEDKVEGVKGVSPTYYASGEAVGKKGSFECMPMIGTESLQYYYKDPIMYGRYFTREECDGAKKVCVIRENAAIKLFGTSDVVGLSFEYIFGSRSVELQIIGVRKDNSSALYNMVAVDESQLEFEMPYTTFFPLYTSSREVTFDSIMVFTDMLADSKAVASQAVSILEARHNCRGDNRIKVEDFNSYLSQINSVIDTVSIFVVFVAAISLLVGGIGVMTIMLVSVTERTREIGIRKALGARTGAIMLQFLCESAIITLIAGIIGIILGSVGAGIIAKALGFKAMTDIKTVLGASVFSSVIGIFFGLYPARKAAKLSPIEALRHE